MEAVPSRYGWVWFAAWVMVGAGVALGLVSLLFLLPVVAVIAILLSRRSTAAQSWWGAISGAGLLLLYVAYVQRLGPGTHCHAIGTPQYPGTQCDEYLDPRPWLVMGIMLLVAGVAGFVIQRRRWAE